MPARRHVGVEMEEAERQSERYGNGSVDGKRE